MNHPFPSTLTAWLVTPPAIGRDAASLDRILDRFLALVTQIGAPSPTLIYTSDGRRFRFTPVGRAALYTAIQTSEIRYFMTDVEMAGNVPPPTLSVSFAGGESPHVAPAPVHVAVMALSSSDGETQQTLDSLVAFMHDVFGVLGASSGGVYGNTLQEQRYARIASPNTWSFFTQHGNGVFWGTALGPDLCARLGGVNRVLADAPVFRSAALGAGVWLQLTEMLPPTEDDFIHLAAFLTPILNRTTEDAPDRRGVARAATPVSLAEEGVTPIRPVPEERRFPVRTASDMRQLTEDDESFVPVGITEDIAFTLIFDRELAPAVRLRVEAVIRQWFTDESARIEADDGVFRNMASMTFGDRTLRWSIETRGGGIAREQLDHLQAWLAAVSEIRVVELVLGTETEG